MAAKQEQERIIMGVDPGTNITGYSFILCKGSKMELMTYGVIDMQRMKGEQPDKLKRIFERCLSLVDEFHPDELSIEAPFYGKNVQSMLKLGRAQGVAMAAALFRDVPIFEYFPKKVKMAITGNGNASKEQVNGMVENLLNFKFDHAKHSLDASDAIALAVCHFFQRNRPGRAAGSNVKSWEAFIAANPDKLKRK